MGRIYISRLIPHYGLAVAQCAPPTHLIHSLIRPLQCYCIVLHTSYLYYDPI